MGEDSSLESKPAEAQAAEANLGERHATKPTIGKVAGLEPKLAEAAKYKIPSNASASKSLNREEEDAVIRRSKYSGSLVDHKRSFLECETKSSWKVKKMRRNENLEELIVAAVEMKVQERMLSSTTGSRLKKREREAFQEKEEKKQMMNSYDH